jgi:hypothetical protein
MGIMGTQCFQVLWPRVYSYNILEIAIPLLPTSAPTPRPTAPITRYSGTWCLFRHNTLVSGPGRDWNHQSPEVVNRGPSTTRLPRDTKYVPLNGMVSIQSSWPHRARSIANLLCISSPNALHYPVAVVQQTGASRHPAQCHVMSPDGRTRSPWRGAMADWPVGNVNPTIQSIRRQSQSNHLPQMGPTCARDSFTKWSITPLSDCKPSGTFFESVLLPTQTRKKTTFPVWFRICSIRRIIPTDTIIDRSSADDG